MIDGRLTGVVARDGNSLLSLLSAVALSKDILSGRLSL